VVDVVLHIGGGKCGSSAIQTALTRQPVLSKEDGGRVGYGFIDNSGRLFHGAQINTVRNARGYHASPSDALTKLVASLKNTRYGASLELLLKLS
jgi:hypothetical protein